MKYRTYELAEGVDDEDADAQRDLEVGGERASDVRLSHLAHEDGARHARDAARQTHQQAAHVQHPHLQQQAQSSISRRYRC